ncbi:MAG: dihydrolipoyl dehydrogenase [Alphaproteobacteria bacterium]
MAQSHDLVIIGGGPGGYVCAIRAAQLGLDVACVEKTPNLGGVCLNVGCIPSKALLHSSRLYAEIRDGLSEHGITATAKLDLAAMMARKERVVDSLARGVEGLFKKNKVTRYDGVAHLAGKGRVAIEGGPTLQADSIAIATGSTPVALPGLAFDEKRILSSTGALSLEKVPKHLAVIGGGYIGLEMGSVWRRLGAQVTVIEMLDGILPGMDREVARVMRRALEKQGVTFRLATRVSEAKAGRGGLRLSLAAAGDGGTGAKADGPDTLAVDGVLVAVGRKPVSDGLGLEAAGVETDGRGFITVSDGFRTSADDVYAIGDVIGGPMLAHKAEEEGVALAERLAGLPGHVNYATVPGVVYTHPEAASVGRSEEALKEAGIAYTVGKFPFTASSRARAVGESEGLVKILADAKSDRILGCHIVGPDAGTLIHEAVMAMEFDGSAEDVARAFHAHPTLNESVKEAALAVAGRAIHI